MPICSLSKRSLLPSLTVLGDVQLVKSKYVFQLAQIYIPSSTLFVFKSFSCIFSRQCAQFSFICSSYCSHNELTLIQIWAFLINHIDKCPVLEDATTTKKVNIKGRQIRTKLYAFKMMMTMRYLLLQFLSFTMMNGCMVHASVKWVVGFLLQV